MPGRTARTGPLRGGQPSFQVQTDFPGPLAVPPARERRPSPLPRALLLARPPALPSSLTPRARTRFSSKQGRPTGPFLRVARLRMPACGKQPRHAPHPQRGRREFPLWGGREEESRRGPQSNSRGPAVAAGHPVRASGLRCARLSRVKCKVLRQIGALQSTAAGRQDAAGPSNGCQMGAKR